MDDEKQKINQSKNILAELTWRICKYLQPLQIDILQKYIQYVSYDLKPKISINPVSNLIGKYHMKFLLKSRDLAETNLQPLQFDICKNKSTCIIDLVIKDRL